jgi:hypothetical protein
MASVPKAERRQDLKPPWHGTTAKSGKARSLSIKIREKQK